MSDDWKRRVALVGTGHRGAGTWGKELLANCGEWVELVGLSDKNSLRLERARERHRRRAPTFTDPARCCARCSPTRSSSARATTRMPTSSSAALEAGVDVITEKPMATTAEMCRRILDAERRTGRRVDVGFNYRYLADGARRSRR